MATSSPSFVPINSFIATTYKPAVRIQPDKLLVENRVCIINYNNQKLHRTVKFHSFKAKAGESDQRTKPNSVICADCDGNGAVLCSQCKGSGVNSVDFFDGQFKAGASCWLCGGKKDMLCGNCNGAGFVGGFMSGFDN